MGLPAFGRALLRTIAHRRRLPGRTGSANAWGSPGFRREGLDASTMTEPTLVGAEQTNTSLLFGDRFILKCFRRVADGMNPDLEIGEYLTERAGFRHVPAVAGAIEYRRGSEPSTLAVLHRYVPNEGDAWGYTLDALDHYLEVAATHPRRELTAATDGRRPLDLVGETPPLLAQETIGSYLEQARLLGERTAELHLAMASASDPAFAPEPFTPLAQRSVYQGMRNSVRRSFRLVRPLAPGHADVAAVLAREAEILERFRALLDVRI